MPLVVEDLCLVARLFRGPAPRPIACVGGSLLALSG